VQEIRLSSGLTLRSILGWPSGTLIPGPHLFCISHALPRIMNTILIHPTIKRKVRDRMDSPPSFVTRLKSSYICMICTRQYVTYPALVRHVL
jgi:hypothetical protein